jgi:hypothetical protein
MSCVSRAVLAVFTVAVLATSGATSACAAPLTTLAGSPRTNVSLDGSALTPALGPARSRIAQKTPDPISHAVEHATLDKTKRDAPALGVAYVPEGTSGPIADPGTSPGAPAALASAGPFGVQSSATYQLSGTLYARDGGFPTGIEVSVCQWNTTICSVTHSATDGTFAVAVSGAYDYRVAFHDPAGNYPDGYYGGWFDYLYPAQIHPSSDISLGTIVLPFNIHLSGTVTNAEGDPLSGIQVAATDLVYGVVRTAVTDSHGNYSITAFAEKSSDQVRFDDPAGHYSAGWYSSTGFSYYQGQLLSTFSDSDIDGLDVILPEARHLSGRVSTPGAMDPLTLDVVAYEAGGHSVTTTTAPDGTFSMIVPQGNYTVEFHGGNVYQTGWYTDAGFVAAQIGASHVIVAGSDVHLAGITLPMLGSHIAGWVTNSAGTGLYNLEVNLFRDGKLYATTSTSRSGNYSIGVEAGVYRIEFVDSTLTYASGWFGPGGFTVDASSASRVLVTDDGSRATPENIVLPNMHRVSGKVSHGTGGVSGIFIEGWVNGVFYSEASTKSDGTYWIPVPPGDCELWFYDFAGRYVGGWYRGSGQAPTLDWAQAAHISVTSRDVAGVNPNLATARHLRGIVSGAGGRSLPDVTVEVYVNGSASSFGVSDGTGSFSIPVSAGTYKVYEDGSTDSASPSGWRSGSTVTADPTAASLTAVGASDVTANITVPSGTRVGGTVRNAGSVGLPGIEVELYAASNLYTDTHTAANGTYDAVVLPGTYRVGFYDDSWTYLSGWYSTEGLVAAFGAATPINATTSDAGRVDAVMLLPSSPNPPVDVSASPYNQSAVVAWALPFFDGGSDISGYTVTSSPEGKTCTATTGALSCTVTGLTNGTPYTFTVTATNGIGTSEPSDASDPVTPIAVPDAPVVTAVGFNHSVVVSWSAPADNGSDISGYTATASPGGAHCTTTTELTCPIGGLTNGTAYTISVTATNGNGTGPGGTTSITPRVGNSFVPLTPNRILNTHTGLGWSSALAPYTAVTFTVINQNAGDPTRNVPANAVAVTGVLSVSNSTALGYLALTPTPVDRPSTSTLNFPKGDARATGVTVPLSPTGTLSVTYAATTGTADASFDLTGYFLAGTSGSTYFALTPNRILDSRNTNGAMLGGLTAGTHMSFQVTGRVAGDSTQNVPANAVAVTGTLTVTGQTAPGFLTVGPDALDAPTTASLFFPKGDNRATGLTVKLGSGGKLNVTYTSATAGAKTQVIFDVNGYFLGGESGAMYVPVTPNRLVDTRSKLGLSAAIKAYKAATFQVTGRVPADATKNVPTGAVAVTGSLTVTGQTALGYLALTKTPINNPTTSTLNFPKGDNRATGVTVPLGPGGKLSVTYGASPSTMSTAVIFDVSGYFVN